MTGAWFLAAMLTGQSDPSGRALLLERRCEVRIAEGEVNNGLLDCGAAIVLQDSAAHYMFRGLQLWRLGRFGEAFSDFSEVLEREPGHCEALAYRGAAALNMGDISDRVMTDLDAAIACNSTSSFAWYTHGVAAVLIRGEIHAALVDFTRAIELDPARAQAFERRAACFDALANTRAAATDRQRAARLRAAAPKRP